MSSCLSSHKQKPPEVNEVPSSWVDKLSNQTLFIAEVTCHCFLSLILLVEKIYIIFFLSINATEIQLIWRMSCFQNTSTKAIVYLPSRLLCYCKKSSPENLCLPPILTSVGKSKCYYYSVYVWFLFCFAF